MDNTNKVEPPMPQQSSPQSSGAPTPLPPQKKLSKKALWAIIGGSIAAIIAIVGIVLAVLLLGGPSKQDYVAAHDQMKQVRNAYGKIDGSVRSLVRVSSASSNGSIKDTVEVYKKEVDKLKGMKAFRDKDLKQKYDAFIERNEKFLPAMEGLVDAADELREVSRHCTAVRFSPFGVDYGRISEHYAKTTGPCVDALKELAKVKHQTLAGEAKKMVELYTEQQKYFEEAQKAYAAQDRAGFTEALQKVRRQASDFRSADTAKKIQQSFDDADVVKQLNDLGKAVTDKVNKK